MSVRLLVSILLLARCCFAEPAEGVFINTLPKSGSVFITSVIGRHLAPQGYTVAVISHNRFHDDPIRLDLLEHCLLSRFLSQEHIDASSYNLSVLKEYLPRFVLHLRDPRQVLISWYYHVEKFKTEGYAFWSKDICPPQEYYGWKVEKKLDWQIEHFLPACIRWIEEWCVALDSGEFDILVTTFEEMVADTPAFFRKVLDFFELPAEEIYIPPFQQGVRHQRKGSVDEWRQMLNPKQKLRMARLIPEKLLIRFGWDLNPR